MKCTQCGFLLAEKDFHVYGEGNAVDTSLCEVVGELRSENEKPWRRYFPRCFRLQQICPEDAEIDARGKAVNLERDCDKFYPYVFGYSPKEHSELELKDLKENKQWRKTLKTSILSIVMGACLRPLVEARVKSWDEMQLILVPAIVFAACFFVLVSSKD